MPSFYPRPRALPLTPPEMFNFSSGGQAYTGPHRKNPYDANAYGPYVAPPAPLMGFQAPPMHYSNLPAAPPGLTHAPQSFGPIAAPILPPIADRAMDSAGPVMGGHRDRHDLRVKEDKPVGGVSAILDYEMDQMTDYVAEMALSLMPGVPAGTTFRKFVSGLLSSTRLPSSTILLGLTYLARRLAALNQLKPFAVNDALARRMLTVALLLGSKFLDDNTFQNRSWSEVSGIPVADLNALEHEWLEAISWNLHVNLETSDDFQAWLVSWPSWLERRHQQRQASLERLTPLTAIETNVQRPRPSRKSSFSPTASSYSNYRQPSISDRASHYPPSRFDQSAWMQPTPAELSPPSAPESGPTTPEYLSLPGSGLPPVHAIADWYIYHSYYVRRSRPSSTQMPYVQAQLPSYGPYHGFPSQNVWNGHAAGCTCAYCTRAHDSYMMGPSFGQQPVAG